MTKQELRLARYQTAVVTLTSAVAYLQATYSQLVLNDEEDALDEFSVNRICSVMDEICDKLTDHELMIDPRRIARLLMQQEREAG